MDLNGTGNNILFGWTLYSIINGMLSGWTLYNIINGMLSGCV